MTKLTNVAEAAAFIHQTTKGTKKIQAKDKAAGYGALDLMSHVYAVRNGQPEVLLTCDDDAIRGTFKIASTIFAGEIVVVSTDGRGLKGERRHMLSIAVDRLGEIGFVQQFYDVTPQGLDLDKPITTGKPSFLKKRVKKEMREMMAGKGLEMPSFLVEGLKKFPDHIDMSPEAIQAFIDTSSASMIAEHQDYIGVHSVALIADPDSPRGKALVRPGMPLLK